MRWPHIVRASRPRLQRICKCSASLNVPCARPQSLEHLLIIQNVLKRSGLSKVSTSHHLIVLEISHLLVLCLTAGTRLEAPASNYISVP